MIIDLDTPDDSGESSHHLTKYSSLEIAYCCSLWCDACPNLINDSTCPMLEISGGGDAIQSESIVDSSVSYVRFYIRNTKDIGEYMSECSIGLWNTRKISRVREESCDKSSIGRSCKNEDNYERGEYFFHT
jgi:hypothetical protein